jgi:hypothetical protein
MRRSTIAMTVVMVFGCADGGTITDTASPEPAFALSRATSLRDPGMESVGNVGERDYFTSTIPGAQWPAAYTSPGCLNGFNCFPEPWDVPLGFEPSGGVGFLTTQNHARSTGTDPGTGDLLFESLDILSSGMASEFLIDSPGQWRLEVLYSLFATEATPKDAQFVITLTDGSQSKVVRKRTSSLRPCPAMVKTLPDDVVDIPPGFFPDEEAEALAAPEVTAEYTLCTTGAALSFSLSGSEPPGRFIKLIIQLDEAAAADGDASTDAPLFLNIITQLFGPPLSMVVEPRRISLAGTTTIDVLLHSTHRFDAEMVGEFSVQLQVGDGGSAFPVAVGDPVDLNGDGKLDRMFTFAVADLIAQGLSRTNGQLTLHGGILNLNQEQIGSFSAVDPNVRVGS